MFSPQALGGTPKAVFHTLEGLLWNVLGVLERWQEELKWSDDFILSLRISFALAPFRWFHGSVARLCTQCQSDPCRSGGRIGSADNGPCSFGCPDPNQRYRTSTQVTIFGTFCDVELFGRRCRFQTHTYSPIARLSLSISYGLTETGGTVSATAFGEHSPNHFPIENLRR